MMNLTKFQNDLVENNENMYLSFQLGENSYAVKVQSVVEIMKVPQLDYPQKLPNKIIGLLQYYNFNLNVLDLRFYLSIKVNPYSVSNQLLIVKTYESMFALIIDKAGSIISLDKTRVDYLASNNKDKIIDFLYKEEGETFSIINMEALESILRNDNMQYDTDIPSLFPKDEESKAILQKRGLMLQEKSNMNLSMNGFAQNNYISMRLGDDLYCITLEHVKEFLKNTFITKVPCSVDYVAGVIPFQGKFVTIIDMKKFLGVDDENEIDDSKNFIIVVEYAEYIVGFLIDELFSIMNISEEQINVSNRNSGKYIWNEAIIDDKLYNILNIKSIFSDERFFIEEN